MNWINEIEEGIRPQVKLLRDNGFNTECSCHHEMYVQCQMIPDGEIKRAHDLLYESGYLNYTITSSIKVINGCVYSSMTITFQQVL